MKSKKAGSGFGGKQQEAFIRNAYPLNDLYAIWIDSDKISNDKNKIETFKFTHYKASGEALWSNMSRTILGITIDSEYGESNIVNLQIQAIGFLGFFTRNYPTFILKLWKRKKIAEIQKAAQTAYERQRQQEERQRIMTAAEKLYAQSININVNKLTEDQKRKAYIEYTDKLNTTKDKSKLIEHAVTEIKEEAAKPPMKLVKKEIPITKEVQEMLEGHQPEPVENEGQNPPNGGSNVTKKKKKEPKMRY